MINERAIAMTLPNKKRKGDGVDGEQKRLTFCYTIVTWFRVAISSRISTESKFPNRSIHKNTITQRTENRRMGVGRSYCSNYGPWPLDFKIGLLLNSAQRKSCRADRRSNERRRWSPIRERGNDSRMPNCKLKSGNLGWL